MMDGQQLIKFVDVKIAIKELCITLIQEKQRLSHYRLEIAVAV